MQVVQPMWPWPVLSHRLRYMVGLAVGTPSALMGRRPVHGVMFSGETVSARRG